jgi:diguanylate cyclase (GGDEF)-like protein
LAEQLVRDLMSTNVLCAAPEASVGEVVALMHERTYSCVLISQDQAPVGIVTERDIVNVLDQILNGGEASDLPASGFMSQPVLSIRDDAPLFEAMVLCRSRNVRHLPVVDRNGRLTGLLTQSVLARAHMISIEEQHAMLEDPDSAEEDLVSANERLKALAHEDALLHIGNRRAMEVDLQYTHEAALRYGTVYAIALCDLDYFKQYNDTCGHQAGDTVLRQVVDQLKASIRKSDRIYRYGGDELLLLLPMTQVDDARGLCERLVEGIAESEIDHPGSPLGALTLSCGVSGVAAGNRRLLNWRQVFDEADNALYRVKRGGRNGVAAFRNWSNKKLDASRLAPPGFQRGYRAARASRR